MTDNWPWQTGQPRQTDQRRQAKAKPGDKNQLFLQNANSELCVSPPTPTPHLFLFFLLPFTSTTKVAVPITVMHIVQRLEVNETVQIHNGCEAKSNSQDSFLDCLHHSRCISLRRGVMTASLNCRGIANDNTDSHTQTHTRVRIQTITHLHVNFTLDSLAISPLQDALCFICNHTWPIQNLTSVKYKIWTKDDCKC